ERRQGQEDMAAAQGHFTTERQALQQEIEDLRQESTRLHQEQVTALHRLEELGKERDQLAAHRDEIHSAHGETQQRFQAEVGRLAQEREESRQQHSATARDNAEAATALQAVQAELDQQRRRKTELQSALAGLRQSLAATRDEAAAKGEQ